MNPQEPNILATPQPSQSLPGSDALALAAAGFTQAQTSVSAISSATAGSVPAAGPTIAEDKDIIEKVWVHHAEQIAAKHKRDPYQQAKALNALKADYMKKRYGKDISVVDD